MTLIPCLCGAVSVDSSRFDLDYQPSDQFCCGACKHHVWPILGTPKFALAVAKASPDPHIVNISSGETLTVSIGPGDDFRSALQAGLSSFAIAKAQKIVSHAGLTMSERGKMGLQAKEKKIKVEAEGAVVPSKEEKKINVKDESRDVLAHGMALRPRVKKEQT